MFQIDKEVAQLLELKAHLGGDDGRPQFVLKTAKVRLQCWTIYIYLQSSQVDIGINL